MNTTLLFIELLITGLQSIVWLFSLVLIISGYSWLQTISFLKDAGNWAALATIFILSFAYALGIIVDRVADALFARWNRKIGKQIIPNSDRPISAMRFDLGKDNNYLNNQFEYTRSRMRIARASSLNFALTTFFVAIFIWKQLQNLVNIQIWLYTIFTLVIGGLLTVLSIYSWYELTKTYYNLVRTNYFKNTN